MPRALADGRSFKRELTVDGLIPNAAGYALMRPLAEAAIAEALKRPAVVESAGRARCSSRPEAGLRVGGPHSAVRRRRVPATARLP